MARTPGITPPFTVAAFCLAILLVGVLSAASLAVDLFPPSISRWWSSSGATRACLRKTWSAPARTSAGAIAQISSASLSAALANGATVFVGDSERRYTSLRAPFDGIVTARGRANPIRLRVFAYVGQDAAPFVHPEDAVTLWQDELPSRRIALEVTRTAGAIDPRTRTMLCEIDLDNRPWGILRARAFARQAQRRSE